MATALLTSHWHRALNLVVVGSSPAVGALATIQWQQLCSLFIGTHWPCLNAKSNRNSMHLMYSTCQLISCTPGLFDSVHSERIQARLAQSVERKALNLVVVGSSPTVGVTAKLCVCLPLLAFVIAG